MHACNIGAGAAEVQQICFGRERRIGSGNDTPGPSYLEHVKRTTNGGRALPSRLPTCSFPFSPKLHFVLQAGTFHPTHHRLHGAESAGPFREALRLTVDAPVPRLSGTALDQLKQTARPMYHRPSPNLRMLKDLVQGGRSIESKWTHLAWPAAGLPRLRPFGTDKDVRTIYFIYGTVTRALVADNLRAAADAQCEGLSLDARGGVHPGHFEKIWHMFIVVD